MQDQILNWGPKTSKYANINYLLLRVMFQRHPWHPEAGEFNIK